MDFVTSFLATPSGAGLTALVTLSAAVLAVVAAISSFGAARAARAAARDARIAVDLLSSSRTEEERLISQLRLEVGRLSGSGGAAAKAPGVAAAPPALTAPPAPSVAEPPPVRPAPPKRDSDAGTDETVMFNKAAMAPQPRDEFHGMVLVRVTAGPDAGREFKLPFETVTVGRAANNRILINEDMASRCHAELRYEGNRFAIKDNGSTNGTLRNGNPVSQQPLEFGDVIAIGKTELLFTCEGHDLGTSDPAKAIAAYERTLERQPDFISALQNLAFLLERDVARRRDAAAVWDRLKKAERR
ncbi:MAG: FHA domain-containing protein [Azospirillum sp.]|nr:FHA domain-containing protein [Azospirillum sp.]